MSRSELHGVVQTLRAYLEYQASDEEDLGFAIDEALSKQWKEYQELKRTMSKPPLPRSFPSEATSPLDGKAHSTNAHTHSTTSPNSFKNSPESAPEEYTPWKTIGPIRTHHINSKGDHEGRPSTDEEHQGEQNRDDEPPMHEPHNHEPQDHASQDKPTPSPSQPWRETAIASLNKRGRWGTIDGKWQQPVAPKEGFTVYEKTEFLRAYYAHLESQRGNLNILFDEGNPATRIMFVEDRLEWSDEGGVLGGGGHEMRNKMICAMKLDPQNDVYMTSLCKFPYEQEIDCRADELSNSVSILKKQVDTVQPDFLVLLGEFSLKVFFPEQTTPFQQLRGNWLQLPLESGHTVSVMPTFSPAYLNQHKNPEDKRATWNDLKKVMSSLFASESA